MVVVVTGGTAAVVVIVIGGGLMVSVTVVVIGGRTTAVAIGGDMTVVSWLCVTVLMTVSTAVVSEVVVNSLRAVDTMVSVTGFSVTLSPKVVRLAPVATVSRTINKANRLVFNEVDKSGLPLQNLVSRT